MIRKCAWCQSYMGEKEPLNDQSVTHGICKSCLAQQPPTDTQVRAIAKLCTIRGIYDPLEETVRTRNEAQSLIYHLRR